MKTHVRYLPTLFVALAFAVLATAEDNIATASKVNDSQAKIQMHEHMAEMHKKAADCLRGGKTEKECHEAMMTECKDMKGQMDCPMMGEMKGMHKHTEHHP